MQSMVRVPEFSAMVRGVGVSWVIALAAGLGPVVIGSRAGAAETPVWVENWEGDWTSNWYVDGGTWEVGEPTSGPGTAFDGSRCAATVLAGTYAEGVNTRLIRFTSFVVPSGAEQPRLRFWHWFEFSCGDYGEVQVKLGSEPWVSISTRYGSTGGGVWSRPSIGLSGYAGQTVQIAFFFHSEDCWPSGWDVAAGWYIDDVRLVTGAMEFEDPERFETGLGDWAIERGTWQAGFPTVGPAGPYEGSGCMGTALDENYREGVDTRLISPPFEVPSATPRLRFWQWFEFSCGDWGQVQLKVGNDPWVGVSTTYASTGGGVWSRASIDLSDYEGQTIQLAFFFHSEDCWPSGWDVAAGWYIDEVRIETGPLTLESPTDFEAGLGDWAVERGTWEIGAPTSGPGEAFEGVSCAATGLHTNYHEGVDTRLISPPFAVPDGRPRFRFWHWFELSCGDWGQVQVKVGDDPWVGLSTTYGSTGGGVWSRPSIDLSDYVGQTVQLAFFFHSEDCWPSGWDVAAGWYIDDARLVTDWPVLASPEGFEGGLGDWSADRGSWEVGPPTAGPPAAHGGSSCAGTVLGGTYHDGTDTRLISPLFRVTEPEAYVGFWHWFDLSCGDSGQLQIRVDDGSFGPIPGTATFTGSGGPVWTFYVVPLEAYLGSTAQFAFSFHSEDCWPSGWDVATGWYVDDVVMEGVVHLAHEEGPDPVRDRAEIALSARHFPNPFRSMATVEYALPREMPVDLGVFDVRGTRVATLTGGRQPGGVHTVVWHGRDSEGRRVANGVYFYRLTTPAGSTVGRMTVLR